MPKIKVLVVEDESLVAKDIHNKLRGQGNKVVGVLPTGRERGEVLGRPLLLAGAVLFALAGLVAFALLFVRKMNVYWFILSPLILAIYQMPSVVLFWLWKRGRKRAAAESEESEPGEDFGDQDD